MPPYAYRIGRGSTTRRPISEACGRRSLAMRRPFAVGPWFPRDFRGRVKRGGRRWQRYHKHLGTQRGQYGEVEDGAAAGLLKPRWSWIGKTRQRWMNWLRKRVVLGAS